MTTSPFLSRRERFETVASTNDIVAGWLDAGVDEVCVASADVQTAGRGRRGRSWVAPSGAALLVSAGFRPSWIEPDRTWRIAATASLAMADAAEDVAGLPDRAILLKWPNDLVILDPPEDGGVARKVGGVLGEAADAGTQAARVVVGIGINVGWPADAFPPDLAPTMTSLAVASGGRPVDAGALLDAWIDRLEARIEALRTGRFDVADWNARQLIRRTRVRLAHGADPAEVGEEVIAIGADPLTGALVVEDPSAEGGERQVHAGEIARLVAGV